jgi:branched-chain amino acid transport system permease protein
MNKMVSIVSVSLLLVLPLFFHEKSYIMHTLNICLIWGVVASAWNLILGYASIFSFAQLAFFTIAGYATGMLSKYLGVSPWLGILLGATLAGVAGIAIALPCLRLTGIFIAVATLALHLILPNLLRAGRVYGTGGTYGLGGIPSIQLGGHTFGYLSWYYLLLGVFLLLLFVIFKIINSRLGLAFVALRDAGHFAKSLGVNEYKYKLAVFGISAFITGIMGGFYSHYTGSISPAMLSTDLFLVVIAMVLFGGLGRFPGGAIGAFAITFANEFLRPTGTFRLLILGAIIVVTMIHMPKGLMGIFESLGRIMTHQRAKNSA